LRIENYAVFRIYDTLFLSRIDQVYSVIEQKQIEPLKIHPIVMKSEHFIPNYPDSFDIILYQI